jgi:hypothetical protein
VEWIGLGNWNTLANAKNTRTTRLKILSVTNPRALKKSLISFTWLSMEHFFVPYRDYGTLFCSIHDYGTLFCSINDYGTIFCSIHDNGTLLCSIHSYGTLFCSIHDPKILLAGFFWPRFFWSKILLSEIHLAEILLAEILLVRDSFGRDSFGRDSFGEIHNVCKTVWLSEALLVYGEMTWTLLADSLDELRKWLKSAF